MCCIDCVILASGYSRRMGSNKLLLPLGKSTVIGSFLESFPYELFQQVILVYTDERVKAAVSHLPVTFCYNDTPGKGKSYSIRKGLTISTAADGIMFLVADQPLLSRSTLALLISVFIQDRRFIVVPEIEGKNANPVIFPCRFRNDLLSLKNDSGGKLVIARHCNEVRSVVMHSAEEFIDIDTPQQYQQVVSLWS